MTQSIEENVLGDNIGFVELVQSMGDDRMLVIAARVSYNRHSEELADKDKRLIQYLMKNNHSSPLEHIVFTFSIKVPFFIERQWNRHRSWKYFSLNEVSRRYSSENLEFYIPPVFRLQNTHNKQMSSGEVLDDQRTEEYHNRIVQKCLLGVDLYYDMVEDNVARELARGALDIFLYTSFYATVDLHNLLWFLELRRHPHAQVEIQNYAFAIERLIENIVPFTYSVWKELMDKKYEEEIDV